MQTLFTIPEKIVLVDEDMDSCALFEAALQEINPFINCICVKQGDDMVQQLRINQPELIFIDINLPSKSGFDCIKKVRENKSSQYTPIVIYSSHEYPRDVNIAYGLGATLYFIKPSTFTEAVDDLRNILELVWHDPKAMATLYLKNGRYYSFNSL